MLTEGDRRWAYNRSRRLKIRNETPEQREERLAKRRARTAAYREKNRSKIRAYHLEYDRAYRELNHARIREQENRRRALARAERQARQAESLATFLRLQREAKRERVRARRKRWEAKHPERLAAARANWFAKNPGYRTQWMRDKRAEVPKRVLKTTEEKKATKREYDRRYYAEHREEKLAKVRERRRAKYGTGRTIPT